MHSISPRRRCWRFINACLVALIVALGSTIASASNSLAHMATNGSLACPFCSTLNLTFSEQLGSNDVAVIVKLVEPPPPPKADDEDFPKGKFEIIGVLKGDKHVQNGMTFRTQLVGSYPEGQKFLVMGVQPPKIAWTTPMRASDRLFQYLKDIQELPEKGPDRLVFFQDYFEDEDPVLAFDAYDEYAKAPYADLLAMKDRMQRKKLVGFIKDTQNTTVNRRRLYLTMLGVCGTDKDVEMLEGFIKSGDRKLQAGLDALIACYLTLKGETGVPLIEKTFLADPDVDYVETLAAVSALRFHATETDIIPREKIVKAVRALLDKPGTADMIIPDLARWEDWSVMDRLVTMFKEVKDDSNWVRVPIIQYLRACPKAEAAAHIEELRKIDPQAVKRADFFIGFGEEEEDDDWDSDDKASDADKGSDKPTVKVPAAKEEEGGGKADSDKVDTTLDSSQQTQAIKTLKVAIGNDRIEMAQGPGIDTGSPVPDSAPSSAQQDSPALSMPSDSEAVTFVSTAASDEFNQPVGTAVGDADAAEESSEEKRQQVAQVTPVAPVAAANSSIGLTWYILFVPFGASLLLLALMWSVVNGWFERLIF